MNKRLITLLVVPAFALTACGEQSQESLAVPIDQNVASQADGSIASTQLLDSYKQAQEQGFNGSIEEWAAISQLHETNPQQAQQLAESNGFSGGEMLMGALAGAAIGGLLASSMNSSRTGMATSTYSSQRLNERSNYAATQQRERDRPATSGGGAVTATTANRTGAMSSTTTRPSVMPSATRSAVTSPNTARSVAVSRGGFGGAVSSGG